MFVHQHFIMLSRLLFCEFTVDAKRSCKVWNQARRYALCTKTLLLSPTPSPIKARRHRCPLWHKNILFSCSAAGNGIFIFKSSRPRSVPDSEVHVFLHLHKLHSAMICLNSQQKFRANKNCQLLVAPQNIPIAEK